MNSLQNHRIWVDNDANSEQTNQPDQSTATNFNTQIVTDSKIQTSNSNADQGDVKPQGSQ